MVVTCMSQHSRNRRFGEQYVPAALPWTISRRRPTWWWKGPSPARPWPRSRPATSGSASHRHGAQRRVGG
ncbi:MAG: hypothetical protein ACLUW6_05210 [Coriobacteriaceae bacterium]